MDNEAWITDWLDDETEMESDPECPRINAFTC